MGEHMNLYMHVSNLYILHVKYKIVIRQNTNQFSLILMLKISSITELKENAIYEYLIPFDYTLTVSIY